MNPNGPYSTRMEGNKLIVDYAGNRIFPAVTDVLSSTYDLRELAGRVHSFADAKLWGALARINSSIFSAAVGYFEEIGASFVPLPLTTRMISSPGAHFGPQQISYTSDTVPVTIQWFDDERSAFLSESSQIYLELSLVQDGISQVFSIYNSFRKEQSDATHLAEFHHIEYEGKVDQVQCSQIAVGLLQSVCRSLVSTQENDLAHFLASDDIRVLGEFGDKPRIHYLSFAEAMQALHQDTGHDRFRNFTLQDTLGAAEEVRLTEICGGFVCISNFPLLEVPFYHAEEPGSAPAVAMNSDFIWPGYREVLGLGQRVGDIDELERKAQIFELPLDDYEPYLQSRRLPSYQRTSGFGLGWERLVQGILRAPFIWSCAPFPRVSGGIAP